MEIDIVWYPVFDHHVSCLKISILESTFFYGQKMFTQIIKVNLKLLFIKFYTNKFQIAIFELIQVKHHAVPIHHLNRITMLIDFFVSHFHLKPRQIRNHLFNECFFLVTIVTTIFSTILQ